MGFFEVYFFMAEGVEIHHADERHEGEFDGLIAGVDGVADADDIVLPGHLDFLDDADAVDFVFPAGERDFEIEAAEKTIAARMEFVAELVDVEFDETIFRALNAECLAKAIEHEDAADGRQERGTEEAVISAGIASDDGSGSEAADAVGNEPFLLELRAEFAVGFDGIEGHN